MSCYISPVVDRNEFRNIMKSMESRIKTLDKGKQVVMCGDFNARSIQWGSKRNSERGNKLTEYMEECNLILQNKDNIPTCVRPQGTSIVDLTWATPGIANKIKEWRIEEGYLSLSDHSYIVFRISYGGKKGTEEMEASNEEKMPKVIRWKMETLDQEIFDEVLKWKCKMHKMEE